MTYELRFVDGTIVTVDPEKALTGAELAALEEGQASLVAVDEQGNVTVLAEVDSKGELLVLGHDGPKGKQP